jgi:protein required for attachment to host cells
MKQTRTWILVADGGKARILETTEKRQDTHLVAGAWLHPGGVTDAGGGGDAASNHVYEALGQSCQKIKARNEPHTALEALFASQLATMLADQSAKQAFDRLIIIAPGTLLGNLHKMIKPEVRNKVVAEIDEDPAHIPNNEIASHVAGMIGT